MLLQQTIQSLKELNILHPDGYFCDWIDPEYSDQAIADALDQAISVNDFYDILYYGKKDQLAKTLGNIIYQLHLLPDNQLTQDQAYQLAWQIPIKVNPSARKHYVEYFYADTLNALENKLDKALPQYASQ